jgi:hypothetical protein
MNGEGTDIGLGNVPPTKWVQWKMKDHVYAHSIGYPGDCVAAYSVTYNLNGSYKWFDAMVGIANAADPQDEGTGSQVEFKVLADPGGGPMRTIYDNSTSWGSPIPIHENVRGATILTLKTSACIQSGSSAVWGDARLLPS